MSAPPQPLGPGAPFGAVVIGASAGGIEPLREVVRRIPADLPAAVLVAVHIPARAPSALPKILQAVTSWPVVGVDVTADLAPGRVYVAVANHHLAIRDGLVVPGHGPRENGHRPSIDVLFRSAARWFGPRAVGVVLSGLLDDGAAGLAAIVARGGAAVVQAPDDAVHASMPVAAIEAAPTAVVCPVGEISAVLDRLLRDRVGAPEISRTEADVARPDDPALVGPERLTRAAGLTCPDCDGSLFEVDDGGGVLRFRCRVGHAWSTDSLLAEQGEQLEGALWAALRVLEDNAALHRRMASAARQRGYGAAVALHEDSASEAAQFGDVVRGVIRRLSFPDDSAQAAE